MRTVAATIVVGLADAFGHPVLAATGSDGARAAVSAGAHAAPHLDGGLLGLVWIVPFVGILLSIAIFPLAAPRFWHRHFGKVSALWGFAFFVPFTLIHGWEIALFELLLVGLLEYVPFIIILQSLFTVAGGIRLKGEIRATPLVNTGLSTLGTAIARWMGRPVRRCC